MKFTFALASLVALAVAEPWATSSGWGSSVVASAPATKSSANVTSATGSFVSSVISVPYSSASWGSSAAANVTSAAPKTSAAATTTAAATSAAGTSAAATSTFTGAAYNNKEFGGAALAVAGLALLL